LGREGRYRRIGGYLTYLHTYCTIYIDEFRVDELLFDLGDVWVGEGSSYEALEGADGILKV